MTFVDHTEFGDHPGYQDLYEYAEKASLLAPPQSFAVEVGTRAGGSALTILDAMLENSKNQWLITVDPYGNKPYLSVDSVVKDMYPDNFYRQAMQLLSNYCAETDMNWTHYKMKSLEWIKHWPKIEFWADEMILEPKIFFLHLDGDHNTKVVKEEIHSFWPYLIDGATICIDDADQIEVDKVCEGFKYVVIKNRVLLYKTIQT
jgi:hypothetical protein